MSHAHQKEDLIPAEELDTYCVITMAWIPLQAGSESEEATRYEPNPLFPEWMVSVNAKMHGPLEGSWSESVGDIPTAPGTVQEWGTVWQDIAVWQELAELLVFNWPS